MNPFSEQMFLFRRYAEAANWYINASDGQLADFNEARDDALRRCHEIDGLLGCLWPCPDEMSDARPLPQADVASVAHELFAWIGDPQHPLPGFDCNHVHQTVVFIFGALSMKVDKEFKVFWRVEAEGLREFKPVQSVEQLMAIMSLMAHIR